MITYNSATTYLYSHCLNGRRYREGVGASCEKGSISMIASLFLQMKLSSFIHTYIKCK